MRLLLARPRGRWFVRNIPLLLMVLLPFFRSLYLLRLITVLRVLRAATGAAFRGRVAIYVSVSAVIIVVIGALGVLDAEQNAPGALITSFPDAVWWALVTITTVGYGDLYPVTGLGRTIATGMMVAGIALVGSVTATFASWFVEQAGKKPASASVGDAREGGQQAR
ncbi:potassium channel family protein, partial [Microcella putealis]